MTIKKIEIRVLSPLQKTWITAQNSANSIWTKTQRFKVTANYPLMRTYLWLLHSISANKSPLTRSSGTLPVNTPLPYVMPLLYLMEIWISLLINLFQQLKSAQSSKTLITESLFCLKDGSRCYSYWALCLLCLMSNSIAGVWNVVVFFRVLKARVPSEFNIYQLFSKLWVLAKIHEFS